MAWEDLRDIDLVFLNSPLILVGDKEISPDCDVNFARLRAVGRSPLQLCASSSKDKSL